MEQLIMIKGEGQEGAAKKDSLDFKSQILADSNKLALFLTLKNAYYQYYDGMQTEYEAVFSYKILSEKKNLKTIAGLITK